MIRSKSEFHHILEQVRLTLNKGKNNVRNIIREFFIPDYVYRFHRELRFTEYYYNTRLNPMHFILFLFYFYRYKRLSVTCGFSIPLNVFGPGLAIVHLGTIVVNPLARVGANCRIHVCTNIGASGGKAEAPQIGDNVYIAPGVKLYGNIKVADNIAFAANAAVHSDCLESNMLYGGVPAKKIGPISMHSLLKHVDYNPEDDVR